MMTTNQQLELGFNGGQSRIYGRQRQVPQTRAQWWFAKMRATVASAWQEQTQARPEQILLRGVNRALKV